MSYPLEPKDHFRLHFVRPRFMSNNEEDLINLCTLLVEEGEWRKTAAAAAFRPKLRRRMPHLSASNDKTVDNYFTEVTSLFSLYEFDGDQAFVGMNAVRLAEKQNIFEFFLHHVSKFQFPGGHVTHETAMNHARNGIKFKPGKFLIGMLMAGQELKDNGRAFGIKPAEATWYAVNDLYVLRGERSAKEAVERLLRGRSNSEVDLGVPFNYLDYGLPQGVVSAPGDFVRYARDCLTMLEYAQIIACSVDGFRYLKPNAYDAITTVLTDDSWFSGYSALLGQEVSPSEKEEVRADWLAFANRWDSSEVADEDLDQNPKVGDSELIKAQVVIAEPPVVPTWLDIAASGGLTANEIGQIGEEIVMKHEVAKLIRAGMIDLAKKVKKIPNQFGVGYDINSWDERGNRISIEVKTTASVNPMRVNSITLTPSEWKAAEQIGLSYLVYRLVLATKEGPTMVVLKDPVNLYKRGELDMTPRDGAILNFDESVVEHVEVLS